MIGNNPGLFNFGCNIDYNPSNIEPSSYPYSTIGGLHCLHRCSPPKSPYAFIYAFGQQTPSIKNVVLWYWIKRQNSVYLAAVSFPDPKGNYSWCRSTLAYTRIFV